MAYREFRPRAELSDLVACTWQRHVPSADRATRVLPDGCVDLIWREGDLFVAGPDREPLMSPVPGGGTIVGLRLRPGAAGGVLGLPASELRDLRVALEDVWGRPAAMLAERLMLAESLSERRRLLEDALTKRRPAMPRADPVVRAAVERLGRPGSRVRALSRALGISERSLLRRFDAAVGYGPKTLDRVLRFQRFLGRVPDLVRAEDQLARVALELGYADQAHLTHECVRLAGLTPTRLLGARPTG
jgi:AraC-like DNA-binding protein